MALFMITLFSLITYDYSNRPLYNIPAGWCSIHCPRCFLWLYSYMYVKPLIFAVDDYWWLRKGDIKEIVIVKFVDYFSDNRELFVYNASQISQFLWCPCILTNYSHKFGCQHKQAGAEWWEMVMQPQYTHPPPISRVFWR